MRKRLISGLMAVSLCLSAANPAAADNQREDRTRLLLGLTALAVIGAALADAPEAEPRTSEANHRGIRPGSGWADLGAQERQRHAARFALPGQCLQTVRAGGNRLELYDWSCLDRRYAGVNQLPAQCAVRFYTANGPRDGFDPQCLRDAGYRSDRRH